MLSEPLKAKDRFDIIFNTSESPKSEEIIVGTART